MEWPHSIMRNPKKGFQEYLKKLFTIQQSHILCCYNGNLARDHMKIKQLHKELASTMHIGDIFQRSVKNTFEEYFILKANVTSKRISEVSEVARLFRLLYIFMF